MINIKELTKEYEDLSAQSRDIATSIASSISMLQLDGVNTKIAEAVVEIEKITQREESFASKIPLLGKYIKKGAAKVKEDQLKTGKMTDVIDRLFKSLSKKKENIETVMETLFAMQDKLDQEVELLIKREEDLKLFIANSEGIDNFKAKTLLAQVSRTIIKHEERIQIIKGTTVAAERSTEQIATLLPSLQGEIVAEMTIQAGLQELKEFKEIFDTTIAITEDLSHTNGQSMRTVLLDVVDLGTASNKDIKRLEAIHGERVEFENQLREKMDKARKDLDNKIDVLTNVRNDKLLKAPGAE